MTGEVADGGPKPSSQPADPDLEWLRSGGLEEARELSEARKATPMPPVQSGHKTLLREHVPAALSLLEGLTTKLAHADLDALFDALDRLEETDPELVELLSELRDVGLEREN